MVLFDRDTTNAEEWFKTLQGRVGQTYISLGILICLLAIFEADVNDIGVYIKEWHFRNKHSIIYSKKAFMIDHELNSDCVDGVMKVETVDVIDKRQKLHAKWEKRMAMEEKKANQIKDDKVRMKKIARMNT